MKNLESLIAVLCLLFVLGCNCQRNFFEREKAVPTSTPTTSTPSSTAKPEETNRYLKTGTYTGRGQNITSKQRGDILLRIDSVDSSGNVEAFAEASNGLQGRAKMTGKIDDERKLTLDGTLDDGQSISISATVSGNKISGGFGIADSKLKTQSGNFTVSRR